MLSFLCLLLGPDALTLYQEEYGVGLDDFGFPMMQNDLSFVPAESQPEANGATAASQEPDTQLPLVNGIAKGGSTSLEAFGQEPRPHGLYDTDLEKMHTDLYKRKYLTPNDFLDDIRKIVHNTYLRFDEDAERFYKAQAMLTAAQVSINEFDLQLRQDCDRMAARERKRREERMRNREKEKGPDESANHGNGNGSGFGYAPGTRRSARQNGQQLEISISDPLKIERRRKRQRAGGEAATDSQGSEADTSDGRTSKRSKMAVSDDEDPLNNLGLGPTSQPRPLVVRFTGAGAESPSHGREHSTAVQQEDVLPLLTTAMAVDEENVTPRRGGFDPFLLNPMPMPASLPLLVSKSSLSSSDPFSAGPALSCSPRIHLMSCHRHQSRSTISRNRPRRLCKLLARQLRHFPQLRWNRNRNPNPESRQRQRQSLSSSILQ